MKKLLDHYIECAEQLCKEFPNYRWRTHSSVKPELQNTIQVFITRKGGEVCELSLWSNDASIFLNHKGEKKPISTEDLRPLKTYQKFAYMYIIINEIEKGFKLLGLE